MCTIIQSFALIFAKELWRVLSNIIGIYLELSSLYITVEIFLPRSFLKATSISFEESFKNLGIHEICENSLWIYQTHLWAFSYLCIFCFKWKKKSFWNVFFTINCEKRLTSLTILSKAWIHDQIKFYEVLRQIYRWFKILHIILFIIVKDH